MAAKRKPIPKKPPQKKSTRRRDAALARRNEAWELRMQGLSYRAIAEKLGRNASSVFEQLESVRVELRQNCIEWAEQERIVELQKLGRVSNRLLQAFECSKDYEALAALARSFRAISERKAKLLGLDAPTTSKTELTGPGGGPLVTASEGWEARLIALGWTPPKGKGKEILPGLPSPGEDNVIDAVASTTVIEVKE